MCVACVRVGQKALPQGHKGGASSVPQSLLTRRRASPAGLGRRRGQVTHTSDVRPPPHRTQLWELEGRRGVCGGAIVDGAKVSRKRVVGCGVIRSPSRAARVEPNQTSADGRRKTAVRVKEPHRAVRTAPMCVRAAMQYSSPGPTRTSIVTYPASTRAAGAALGA